MPREDRSPISLDFVTGTWKGERRRFRDGVLLIGVVMPTDDPVPQSTFESFEAELGARIERAHHRTGWASFQGGWSAEKIEQVAKDFKANHRDDVSFVQPDFIATTAQGTGSPDIYGEQWALEKIDLKEAWALHGGAEDVLIAVVDSGMPIHDDGTGKLEVYHEDIDPDRFLTGVDVVDGGPEATAIEPHGLFVTGSMVARVDDKESAAGEVGIKGINLGSPVFACRAVKIAETAVSLVREGIEEAVSVPELVASGEIDPGPYKNISRVVVNVSLTLTDSELPDEALDNLMSRIDAMPKVLLCCSTGSPDRDDYGNLVREVKHYPAAYSLTHPTSVVAVGGTKLDGDNEVIDSDSAIGEHVNLVAPARDIMTTFPMEGLEYGSQTTSYSTESGTSMAAPFATAIASLVWSKCPNIDSEGVKACLTGSCEDVPKTYGETMDVKEWGSGRINAYNAIPDVVVLTTSLAFTDVAPGATSELRITLRVKSPIPLTLSAASISVDAGSSTDSHLRGNMATVQTTVPSNEYETVDVLTVTYLAGAPGSFVSATVKVQCLEFGEAWSRDVLVTANTHAGTSFIMLCADKSGSMNFSSGVGTRTRKTVLTESAGILVDTAPDGTAMDVVSFDADAHDGPGTVVLASNDNSRTTLKNFIAGLESAGSTSIGDAVEKAQLRLDAESAYDNQAMIVLTDGKETAPKYLHEVSISKDVYAIGMGTPASVSAEALTTLVMGNENGYLLMTGPTSSDDEFKIAKYLQQILCDIKNFDIAADPTGRIKPGMSVRIPFYVSGADASVEVVAMMPVPGAISLRIEPPHGPDFDPEPGGLVRKGDNVSVCRFDLPLATDDDGSFHAGLWNAILDVDKVAFNSYATGIPDQGEARRVQRHGMLYTVAVNVSSDVRMSVELMQNAFVTGSAMTLRATLRESGTPMTDKTQVEVHVRYPDGSTSVVRLHPTGPGVFEATQTLSAAGVYECRFVGSGRTREGDYFAREHVRTAFIGSGVILPGRPIPVR